MRVTVEIENLSEATCNDVIITAIEKKITKQLEQMVTLERVTTLSKQVIEKMIDKDIGFKKLLVKELVSGIKINVKEVEDGKV